MRVLTPHLISDKTVMLRLDLDVSVKNGQITEDFRLRAGLPTLYLCLQYAKKVIVMGHLGRPKGEDKSLSVAPIVDWLDKEIPNDFPDDRLQVLENLRFEAGEEACDPNYAKELASMGDFFVNEAFAAHHPSASTTVLPTLLPGAFGFHFDHEVRELTKLRTNPDRPMVMIIGGAKIEDKLGVVEEMEKLSDHVLLGGKLPSETREKNLHFSDKVIMAQMSPEGTDLSDSDLARFAQALIGAKSVVWSGPMGKFEEGFQKGNSKLAELIIESGVYSVIGGGDTISALDELGFLNQFSFVSTGGGAMLDFLSQGTLPTIEVMN